ncbi:hypothetical protein IP91_02591 [Pseudoduganella lurida]|uniref:Uncharacterized protein n=1 Tax=Pseudoduganella lurida TaxID=1036180 RepID=A0A562R9C8_9BURK|nr:hypothetical protein [Pseudoduganella lurida]TWI65184.1 hypothetical protein IP91_02591 [Pseudoduganella lurida]
MKAMADMVVDGVVFVEETRREVRRAPVAARAIPVAVKVAVDPLDYCLDLWTQWQRRDDTRLGWRGKCAIVEGEDEADTDALYSGLDDRVAEAVEAMMKSLPRHLDWAIRQRCRIATVWRFPSLVFGDVLPEAEAALRVLLQKNIATRCMFV